MQSQAYLKMEEVHRREVWINMIWKLNLLFLALNMEEGGMDKRMQVTSRTWKTKEMPFPLEPPERNRVLLAS